MVLVTTEAFSREVYASQGGGGGLQPQQQHQQQGAATQAKRHHSILILSACNVDSLCCAHMLQVQAWARSHFNDRQYAGKDVAVDLVFVRSAADVLQWLDRQLEVSSGGPRGLHATYLSHDAPRESSHGARLPFYERIFLVGLGAASQEEDELGGPRGAPGGPSPLLSGLTTRLYAAVTDVLLQKAVQQRAWEEVREQQGLRGAPLTLGALPPQLMEAFKEEAAAREAALRREVKVVVLDSQRPVHQALMQEEGFLLLVDEGEVEALQTAASLRAAGAPSRGHHHARPCALLLAAALPRLYPIESCIYAFMGAVAAAAALHQDRVSIDEYNDWILSLRGASASSLSFLEDDSNCGLLPLLRNGCLEDSLSMCPDLLFKHLGAPGVGWIPWHHRMQQLSNQLRVSCGIECRDMQHYFNGLSARQQQTVFSYLRQALSLPDRLCVNWVRHTDHAKQRGSFSSVPNADAAWLIGAVLSKWRGEDEEPLMAARANAIDALQLVKCLTTASISQKATALQLLQQAQSLLKSQLSQLFLQVDLLRYSVAQGVLMVTVKSPPPFVGQSSCLRALCLLAALRQGGGSASRRLAVVLLCQGEAPAQACICCCTPGADRHMPDLFPSVVGAAERLAGRTNGPPVVTRDPQDPYLLHVSVPRVAVDVQKQVALLYAEAVRRREEADAEEDYLERLQTERASSEQQQEEEKGGERRGSRRELGSSSKASEAFQGEQEEKGEAEPRALPSDEESFASDNSEDEEEDEEHNDEGADEDDDGVLDVDEDDIDSDDYYDDVDDVEEREEDDSNNKGPSEAKHGESGGREEAASRADDSQDENEQANLSAPPSQTSEEND
ncbi:hypothetical protein Esti_000371 [Eimeria stiedai]